MKKVRSNTIYSAIVFCIVAIFAILSFVGQGQTKFGGMYAKDSLSSIQNKWTNAQGKKVDLNHITPTSKKAVNLYYQLPKEITGGQYVIFFSNNIKRVDAYIGNKHIYQSHAEIAADWLNFTEHWEAFTNNIAISKSDAGKKLRVKLTGFYYGTGQISHASLGSEGAFYSHFIQKNANVILLAVIEVVLGITSIFFALFAPLDSRIKRSLAYYAISVVLCALLQIQSEMQLTAIFGNYRLWRLFTYPVLVALPYLLVTMINEQLEFPKEGNALYAFGLTAFSTAYVLYNKLARGIDFNGDLPVLILLVGLAYVSGLVIQMVDYRYVKRLQKQEIAEEKEDPEFSGDDFKIRQDVHWAYFASLSVMLICLACDLFGRHFVNYSAAVTGYPFTRYGFFLSQLGMFVQFFVSELNVMKRQGHDDTYNEMVNYDQLTGLYTQYYLTDKISKERAEDPSLMPAVIYINLAKFKLYNVINGHEKGDECLKQVADILKSVFGEENLARFGNDHFVIIDFDDENSIAKVEKANQLVAQIDLSFKLYLKAGIYYSDGSKSVETEYDYAKTACDEVKDGAENCYQVYTAEFSERAEYTKFVVDHIDDAIQNGDIQVYYQPQVHLMNGKLNGLEALVRWNDPNRGFMSPGRFVPILEDSNLTYKLDLYVLEEAIKLIKSRLNQGLKMVPISFNLSRTDFVTSDPNQILLDLVKKYDIPREMLRVEITEPILTEDPVKIKRAIDRFHQNGFQVLMDDFGSGASSLNTLKEYGFDEIKLDMTFMRKFDEKSEKVVKPLITMAKSLGVHTLCEGVETKEQIAFLKSVGCELVQGYYYSKPNIFTEVVDRLDELGVDWESVAESAFFETAGLVDVNVAQPLALLAIDGQNFKSYYMNGGFRSFAAQIGVCLIGDHDLAWDNLEERDHLLQVANVVKRSSHERKVLFEAGSLSYQLSFQMIANIEGKCLLKVLVLSSQRSNSQVDNNEFDNLPLPYFVVRPYYDSDKDQAECEIVSVNRAFTAQVDLAKNDLLGKKMTEVLAGGNLAWVNLPLDVLRTSRARSERLYSKYMQAWTEFTVLPATLPGCVAFAFTKIEDNDVKLKALKTGNVNSQVSSLARSLNGPEDAASEINFSMVQIASLLEPERVYTLANENGKIEVEAEWTKDKSMLRRMSDRLAEKLPEYLEKLRAGKDFLLISDMERLRFDRELYEINRKNVRILMFPLFSGQKLLGYIGVENFDSDRLAYAKDLLSEYSKYLAAKLVAMLRLRQLDPSRGSDHLTALGNQAAFNEELDELKEQRQVSSLIYFDLYNLQAFNASHDPQEGNLLLQNTADFLNQYFDVRQLYRIGGKLFAAVMPEADQAELDAKMAAVKEGLKTSDPVKLKVAGKLCPYPRHVRDVARQLEQEINSMKVEA